MTSINFVQQIQDGSNYYRIQLPCKALKAAGFDAELVNSGEEVRDADVWVFNRPATRKAVEVVMSLKDMDKRVIVDMDDRFDCLRPGHSLYGPRAEAAHEFSYLACKYADMVTGTTRGVLVAYGRGNSALVPNYIPRWYLELVGRHTGPTKVGWSGTVSSHPNDLQVTNGQVARAIRDHPGSAFAYVGPKEEQYVVRKALKIRDSVLTAGWFRFTDYPKALAEFDVGIVPLESCTFNDGKSWLKLLELSAVGVPTVASPTEPNKQLLDAGCGISAGHGSDWRRNVSKLLASADYRAEVAGRSREIAASKTVDGNIGEWADVILRATSDRRRDVLVL